MKEIVASAISEIDQARFWSCVARSQDCWKWEGYVDVCGYGTFTLSGRNLKAHRVAYALTFGKAPEGLFVCHRCDNPPCVNPAHLFAGTNQDNMDDQKAKGRGQLGERHGNAKLTNEKVIEIRKLASLGLTHKEIGRRFGVDRTNIGLVVLKKAWIHI